MGKEEKEIPAVEKEVKTFDDILSENKEYQSAFDKRISKALETAQTKWQEESEAKQNEAQKLAKMKEDEKVKYELEKKEKELSELQGKLNSKNLKEEAIKIATEKDLPLSYLELVDFTKETADSINKKIETITSARSKDLEGYLNSKLKEKPPVQKQGGTSKDPYLDGFNNAWKR